MEAKIIIDYGSNRFTDAALSLKADNVVEKMKNNGNFPEAETLTTNVATSNDSYKQALARQSSGGKEATAYKRQCRLTLEKALRQLAAHVQTAAQGDEIKILSSGFDIRKKPSPIGVLPKPTLTIKVGHNHGSLDLLCTSLNGAKAYEFRYTEAPVNDESQWTIRTNSKSMLSLSELKCGQEYAFSAAGVGASSLRVWSEVVTSYVL